ncbi:hypothetical protein MMYC01_209694 [Madurella mycetomatis]|uniref:Uncharacterized protein n=1 Tax=Madurella mycetomatis TaxID=100816 RepID=A0A175VT98_9PEZI|nr:hypothetical protein MMYC01_209694 [Madurella mycetomatis]
MDADNPPHDPAITLPATTFSPVEPRKDGTAVLRRDSGSSRSSPHPSTTTPSNNNRTPNTPTHLRLGSESPPLTPFPNALLPPVDEESNTPSSTVVEFGDLVRSSVPSAAELVDNIHRSYSQSQASSSHSRSVSKPREAHDSHNDCESRAASPVSRGRSQSTPRRPTNPRDFQGTSSERSDVSEKGLADDRIIRFFHSMAQQAVQSSESELLRENRGLYQRVAALQLTERELLAENQNLTRKYAALKHHHDRRARQWTEGLRRKEVAYEARIQEMGEQLLDLAGTYPKKVPTVLSNEDVSAWFEDQDAAWNSWACTFGHRDPDRLTNALHPTQLQELCDDVKWFVRMTDTGMLPVELLTGGEKAVHTLLNGMLANFICAEIIASPFWVYNATSLGTIESPGTALGKSLPAVGFRMDMNTFNDVAPARPGRCPTPGSPKFPPPLITSMMPSLSTSLSMLGLPVKPDMERLFYMLTDAQEENSKVVAHHWRAQMIRLFADGGFSFKDVEAAGRNESRRSFVESRLNYARKLRERFLGGAARFLLHDQDSKGIEKLERMLTDMIDDALRFSCRLWSRVTPIRLHGLKELGDKDYRSSSQLITLCRAQAPVSARGHQYKKSRDSRSRSPINHGERSIVMVVQPAVVTTNIDGGAGGDVPGGGGVSLVWLRARVMVAASQTATGSPEPFVAGVGSQSLPVSKVVSGQTPSSSLASSSGATSSTTGMPNTLEMLPASSYKVSSDKAK